MKFRQRRLVSDKGVIDPCEYLVRVDKDVLLHLGGRREDLDKVVVILVRDRDLTNELEAIVFGYEHF